jgi:hypothetical protein
LTNLYPVKIGSDVIGVGVVMIDITEWARPCRCPDVLDHAANARP